MTRTSSPSRSLRTSLRRGGRALLGPMGGVVVLAALLAVTAAACGDDSSSSTSRPSTSAKAGGASGKGSLAGSSWVLTDAAPGGRPPTLDFLAGGRLTGSTGCNNVAGSYRQSGSGSALSITLGPMTKVACTDPAAQSQEDRILADLPKIQSFSRSGSTLELQGSGGTTLLTYQVVSQDLAGTSWTATGVNNGRGGVESTDQTGQLTAAFGTDGTVSGNAACNTFTGSYGSDGTTISITGLASTTRACEPDTGDLERQYLAALGRATAMKVTGDTLELRDGSGALQVSFRSGS